MEVLFNIIAGACWGLILHGLFGAPVWAAIGFMVIYILIVSTRKQ